MEFSNSTQDGALKIFCDHENQKTMQGMGFLNVEVPVRSGRLGGLEGAAAYRPDFLALVQHDRSTSSSSGNAAGPQLFVHAEFDQNEHRTRDYHDDLARLEAIIKMLTTQSGRLAAGRFPEGGAPPTAFTHDVLGFRVKPDSYVDSENNRYQHSQARRAAMIQKAAGPEHLQMLVLQGACKLWNLWKLWCPQLM